MSFSLLRVTIVLTCLVLATPAIASNPQTCNVGELLEEALLESRRQAAAADTGRLPTDTGNALERAIDGGQDLSSMTAREVRRLYRQSIVEEGRKLRRMLADPDYDPIARRLQRQELEDLKKQYRGFRQTEDAVRAQEEIADGKKTLDAILQEYTNINLEPFREVSGQRIAMNPDAIPLPPEYYQKLAREGAGSELHHLTDPPKPGDVVLYRSSKYSSFERVSLVGPVEGKPELIRVRTTLSNGETMDLDVSWKSLALSPSDQKKARRTLERLQAQENSHLLDRSLDEMARQADPSSAESAREWVKAQASRFLSNDKEFRDIDDKIRAAREIDSDPFTNPKLMQLIDSMTRPKRRSKRPRRYLTQLSKRRFYDS